MYQFQGIFLCLLPFTPHTNSLNSLFLLIYSKILGYNNKKNIQSIDHIFDLMKQIFHFDLFFFIFLFYYIVITK